LFSLASADVAATIEITDADVRRWYDTNRARFTTAERRHIQQIVFPSADEAKAAAERLAGGLTFEALAAQRNLQDNDIGLGLKAKTDLVDRIIAEAAFALPEGQTSAPINGRFGIAILRVIKIEPEKVRPFEEVAAEIKTEVTRERARPELQNLYDKIEDDRASSMSLEDIAKKYQLKVRTIEVDRSGRDQNGTPVGDLPPIDVVASAFASDKGTENDVLRTQDGVYVWYEVTDIERSRERTLDEVKDKVEAAWLQDQIAEAVTAKA